MTSEFPSSEAFFLPPIEYLGLIETINANTRREYRLILADVTMRNDQCLIVVGSDGKQERHTQSRTEFVLLQFQPDPYPTARQITNRLLSYSDAIHFELGQSGTMEVRTLAHSTLLSYAYGNRDLVYPDRLLHATIIFGNEVVYREARLRTLTEISGGDPRASRIRRTMANQLRHYRRATQTGLFRQIQVVDHVDCLQYYDENPPLSFGFKMGWIRAVQRRLDLMEIKAMRQGIISPELLAQSLPSNTYDRIMFFNELGLISGNQSQAVIEAYAWFLQRYHQAQEVYKRSHRSVALPYSHNDFERFKVEIDRFTSPT